MGAWITTKFPIQVPKLGRYLAGIPGGRLQPDYTMLGPKHMSLCKNRMERMNPNGRNLHWHAHSPVIAIANSNDAACQQLPQSRQHHSQQMVLAGKVNMRRFGLFRHESEIFMLLDDGVSSLPIQLTQPSPGTPEQPISGLWMISSVHC